MKKNKILLFIPMYNCEKQIRRVLSQLDKSVIKYLSEVIVVNNLSTDKSEKEVLKHIENENKIIINLLRNDENYNLGGSHKVAFNYAIKNGFDYVIVLHGDDQGNIKDFLPLLKSNEYEKYDCVLGSRFMKNSNIKGYSKLRIFGNKIFNCLFSMATFRKITDLGSGLNMYKVKTLESKYYINYPNTLYFNDLMILASCYYKHNFIFYPISWREEDQVSNNKLLSFSKSLLIMLFKYVFIKTKYMKTEFSGSEQSYTYKKINKKEVKK